jgi:RND family efflux transporter MFP subunit
MKPSVYLILLLALVSIPLGAAETGAKKPRASIIVSEPLREGMINPLQTYVGTLYYDRQSKLASEFDGVVESIAFSEGDRVKKGALLIKLDTSVLESQISAKRASIEALQANLTRQERELERTKAIFERKSISQSSYDQVYYAAEALKAQLKAAQSELRAMEIEKGKMHIRAPFDGIITARHVDLGEWTAKGSAVATIVDPDSIEARVSIPARLLDKAYANHAFTAVVEDKELQASIKNIIPVADPATRTFQVEMALKSDHLLIEGMRIDVKVPLLRQENALLIPRDAVIKRFGQMVVFAAVDGKAVMLPVQVVGYKENMAAIRGQGLQPGMRIVTKGNERVFPNMPVIEK